MDYIQLSHNHYTEETLLLPFAFTDLVAKISGETKQAYLHTWQTDPLVILGMRDQQLPQFFEGAKYLNQQGYLTVIRNAGGLAVLSDPGILNVTLSFPKDGIDSIDAAYDVMFDLTQKAYPNVKVEAKEIVDSYCPGKYDLSVNGQKIAGIAQRRVNQGIAVMMYLGLNGDQLKRGQLIQNFYEIAGIAKVPEKEFPHVRPASMTTLEALNQIPYTTQEVINHLKETLHIQQEMHDGAFIANFGLTDELNQRFQSMRTRNQKLQEELL